MTAARLAPCSHSRASSQAHAHALPAVAHTHPYLRARRAKRATNASRVSPRAKDRLTRVQQLFTRNPSPLQSSGASPEYLLLPPRSAPEAAPGGLAPSPLRRTPLRSLLLVGPSSETTRPRTTEARALARRSGMGATLKRHPFSGLVASAGESLHTP